MSDIAVATFSNLGEAELGRQGRSAAGLFATDTAAPFLLQWWSPQEGAADIDATDADAVAAAIAAADAAGGGAAASPTPGGHAASQLRLASFWLALWAGRTLPFPTHPPAHPPAHPPPHPHHTPRALLSGAGSTTFSYAAGEHSHRFLPGCWSHFGHIQPEQPKRRRHLAQQQQRGEEVLVVARLEQDQQREDVALLPAAPASPFPAARAGSDGAGVLASENKYWHVLSSEEQQHWRLPPAAPAFTSWLLRGQPLVQLSSAVAAAWTNSSSGACDRGWGSQASCATMVPILYANAPEGAIDMAGLAAQMQPHLDEQEMRSRLAYSDGGGGGGSSRSPPRSWLQLLTLGVWAPVSAWLQLLVSAAVAAAQWHVTRRTAAAGEDEHSSWLCLARLGSAPCAKTTPILPIPTPAACRAAAAAFPPAANGRKPRWGGAAALAPVGPPAWSIGPSGSCWPHQPAAANAAGLGRAAACIGASTGLGAGSQGKPDRHKLGRRGASDSRGKQEF